VTARPIPFLGSEVLSPNAPTEVVSKQDF